MGACQAYGMIIITLQGKAEIQTVKKKQVSQPRSVKKTISFTAMDLTIQKGM